jgi:outer membrane protein assembly factor BamB
MQHTYSSPCLSEGRLYVGEGMHGNEVCKLYCLDAASGRKLWHCVTGGHIESSPSVADGVVVFGSGDDGIYGVDSSNGEKRWRREGRWHVDVRPAIVEGRVYAGSGRSERYKTTEIFCLDLADGRTLWKKPTELPVWSSPTVWGDLVYFGTGTGRLTESAQPPDKAAGILVCAETATGRIAWTYRTPDAILARCTVDSQRVYFGARDGRCYCLDRRDGQPVWQCDLGQPIVTQPALLDGRLYVAAIGGRFTCLEADSGRSLWTFDVAQQTQTRPQLLSSPVAVRAKDEEGSAHRLFLGTELRTSIKSAAVLYCLRDELNQGG